MAGVPARRFAHHQRGGANARGSLCPRRPTPPPRRCGSIISAWPTWGSSGCRRRCGNSTRAEQLDPKLSVARLNQAIALLNLQRFAEARRLLRSVVERAPATRAPGTTSACWTAARGRTRLRSRIFSAPPSWSATTPTRSTFWAQPTRNCIASRTLFRGLKRALALNPFPCLGRVCAGSRVPAARPNRRSQASPGTIPGTHAQQAGRSGRTSLWRPGSALAGAAGQVSRSVARHPQFRCALLM